MVRFQPNRLALVLVASASWTLACGSSGESGSGGAAGRTGSGGGGGSAGTSAGGGSAGGTTGSAGSTGNGGSSAVNLDQLGSACTNEQCPSGLTPVAWCGISGCSGSSQCTCEIPCEGNPDACPAGSTCANISDGPGYVCMKS